jgi:hypothetical protein
LVKALRLILPLASVALIAGTAHALVLCTMPDGKTYAADEPPPGCVAKSKEVTPTTGTRESPDRAAAVRPPPSTAQAERQQQERMIDRALEIDRRRRVQAVAMQTMVNRSYSNGRFLEGTLTNSADFPVYGVSVCIDSGNVCRYTAPPTLRPGAQGAFSFPTNLLGVPDWRVTWDVFPQATE